MSKNNVIDNVKYLLSHWCKWNKKSFLYVAIRIPALIVVPILIAYVPKLILECIDQNSALYAAKIRWRWPDFSNALCC